MVGIVERIASLSLGGVDTTGAGLLIAIFTGIDLVSITLGLLIRHGIGWLIAVNVVAVITFIYLTALPNLILLFYGVLYGFVLVILMVQRPWFQAMGRWRQVPATRR
jgi:hypothetical protein